jgi:hypothetical protein
MISINGIELGFFMEFLDYCLTNLVCLYIMIAMSTLQRGEPAQDSIETVLLSSGYYRLSDTHKKVILAGVEQLAAQSMEGGDRAHEFTGEEKAGKPGED